MTTITCKIYPKSNIDGAGPERGGFDWRRGRERDGAEIPLDRRFVRDGEVWRIPAVYACAIGVIGCADDAPGAVAFGGGCQGRLRAACSALRFEPADDVEWRVTFYEKRHEAVTVELI